MIFIRFDSTMSVSFISTTAVPFIIGMTQYRSPTFTNTRMFHDIVHNSTQITDSADLGYTNHIRHSSKHKIQILPVF